MVGIRTFLSLALIIISVQADSQRREPSLFLGYERDLKKLNEAAKHDDNPFIKTSPQPITILKPTPPTTPTVKAVTATEVVMPVLKNEKSETDSIGQNNNPFLVISKPAPAPASANCPEDSAPKNTPSAIVKNIKSAKDKLLSKAKEFLGTPYGFGNRAGDRTDCSGFTQQVYSQFGISLPRSAAEQAQLGENVDLNDLQVGDLLFYRTYKSDPSHVAIYAGNGQIIHASFAAKKVQYDSIDKDYYKQRFLYAKRIRVSDSYVD